MSLYQVSSPIDKAQGALRGAQEAYSSAIGAKNQEAAIPEDPGKTVAGGVGVTGSTAAAGASIGSAIGAGTSAGATVGGGYGAAIGAVLGAAAYMLS